MLIIYWELKQHNEILNKTAFYQFQGILFKLLFYTNYILFLSQNLILFKVTLIKQLETMMAYICYNNKPIQVSAIAIKSLHSEIINMWLYACQTPTENAGFHCQDHFVLRYLSCVWERTSTTSAESANRGNLGLLTQSGLRFELWQNSCDAFFFLWGHKFSNYTLNKIAQ